MFEKSIIVAAHPDDEVIWFSSILAKVNEIVICFLKTKQYPWWIIGRQKSLEEHPIQNISCLNINEADVFNGADWRNPVATKWGIKIVDKEIIRQSENYKRNYEELKERLEMQLEGYRNVFTHNPWGEYGHEEHVQVYRVLKNLQHKMGFDLWYSNYVGKKSRNFMSDQQEKTLFDYITCPTDRALAHDVMKVYQRNKCWTWSDEYEWPDRESFIKEDAQEQTREHGRPFPANFIKYRRRPPVSYYSQAKGKVKRRVKGLLKTAGLQILRFHKPRLSKCERVVSLQPEHSPLGTVLLSWVLDPFLLKPEEPISNSHTQYWDSFQIARTFLDLGYAVDVIDSYNQTFQPTKPYSLFVGHRANFDRLASQLKRECIKIAHLDTAHWIVNNQATYRRKFELQQRKSVTIRKSHRLIERNLAIEHSDYAIEYGNQFTLDTYRYANKPLFRVPISTCAQFPWPEQKDHDTCRTNFLWFGSHGFVHKGLDLVLEAFADMPEKHLYVCGPLEKEKEFLKVFYKELFRTPNIHAIGWVDVSGPKFIEIADKCAGVVYPSCSEGGGGSVIACMHAGLIPLVSYEASVDVDDFGIVFNDNSIQTIQDTVQMVSNLASDQLQDMSRKAWEFARANHTKKKFAEAFKNVVVDILAKAKSKEYATESS